MSSMGGRRHRHVGPHKVRSLTVARAIVKSNPGSANGLMRDLNEATICLIHGDIIRKHLCNVRSDQDHRMRWRGNRRIPFY
jgi:hypothetical protein